MPRKPKPPKPTSWNIYKAKKAVWLGTVEAPDKGAAIEKGAQKFKAEVGASMRCRCDDAERGGGAALLPPCQQRTIPLAHPLLFLSG
jgi:hypothetical protein